MSPNFCDNNMNNVFFTNMVIDTQNGSSDPRIIKALDKSFKLLGIMEFIEVIQFKIDMVMTRYFCQEPDYFKMAIMQLKTKHGDMIRQYYIDLENILKLYIEYTGYFNHRESQRKIMNIEQMMTKMEFDRQKDRAIITNLVESNKLQEHCVRLQSIQLEHLKKQNDVLIDGNNEIKSKMRPIVEHRKTFQPIRRKKRVSI